MRGIRRSFLVGAAVAAICFAVPSMAQNEISVSFSCVTFNNVADAASGQAQLSATVRRIGSGSGDAVYLVFANAGPAPCSITRVYLDGTGVSALAVVSQSTGVSFASKANGPRNLPGGQMIGFTADVFAGARPAVQPNGVNPGESLVLAVQPARGVSPDTLFAALVGGQMRIGLHVQGFAGDGSESFVGVPTKPDVIPDA